MQHKVKVTVIDKKVYPELQAKYYVDPNAGGCPCYNVGDEFLFEAYENKDDFCHMGLQTLTQNDSVTGNTAFPYCSEAWDAISRYIYTGLQGGAIMRNWTNDERIMIACCSDGTRPVIFKIERMDYKAVYIEGIDCDNCREKIKQALKRQNDVIDATFRSNEQSEEYLEVFVEKEINDAIIINAIRSCGEYEVTRID